ncbi:hypothetical protein FHS95_000281 [Sphingomonas naasensis]|uniref:DUF2268 domain-containing protein n=1 Tax=Sphingomonas naasensis TaxID=1344951 RepID=A0A4S1WUH3_9SPHN|nr:hypothetical protein [Sphingomonas naasensis]NIJ18612.1 hypothetical protein [Sphingomonas naasensis]TGX45860.1 hypothetical protein E5A74_01370 [Sphingomonas naasensis]
MIARLVAIALTLVGIPASAQTAPAFTSYTTDFDRFATETQAMPEAERVKLFRARFNRLLPGFYEPRNGLDDAKYDARVAKALADYPAQRDKYLAAATAFRRAYTAGIQHFRVAFPDFRPTVPIYLVHSLGEMDGGGRTLRGKDVMVFGADVIARIHDTKTIGPFFDHELFHIYHGQYFADCGELWCSLWIEGLAVYAAARMNPGVDDSGLLLNQPRPIRPEVEPKLAEVVCFTRGKFASQDKADIRAFFVGGSGATTAWPPRFGYYLGYRLAQTIGATHDLATLAKMPPEKVKPLLQEAMAKLASCS